MTSSRLLQRAQFDAQAEVLRMAAVAEANRLISAGDERSEDEIVSDLVGPRALGHRHRADCRYSYEVARRTSRVVGPRISRDEVINRDRSICHLCGKVCSVDEIHLDHVIPLARGGEHSIENLKVACAPCNRRKGARIV